MVIEEFMTGVKPRFCLLLMERRSNDDPPPQDHKRAKDGNQGLNTGGMGTLSEPILATLDEVDDFCNQYIFTRQRLTQWLRRAENLRKSFSLA